MQIEYYLQKETKIRYEKVMIKVLLGGKKSVNYRLLSAILTGSSLKFSRRSKKVVF